MKVSPESIAPAGWSKLQMLVRRIVPMTIGLALLALTACAPQTVTLINGQSYPGDLVFRSHPLLRNALRANPVLLRSGHDVIGLHCYLSDERDNLNRVSLLAIMYAGELGLRIPAFGGAISNTQIQRARGSIDHQIELFRLAITRLSGGDPGRALELLKAAERHDASCVRRERLSYEAQMDAMAQGLRITHDSDGMPIVTRAQPDTVLQNRIIRILRNDQLFLDSVILLYEAEYATQLSRQDQRPEPSAIQASPAPPAPQLQPTPPVSPAVRYPQPSAHSFKPTVPAIIAGRGQAGQREGIRPVVIRADDLRREAAEHRRIVELLSANCMLQSRRTC